MSKKDYQAIAAAIYRFASKEDEPARGTAYDVAERLADVFAADNPRFDRARFLEACETGRTKGMRQVGTAVPRCPARTCLPDNPCVHAGGRQ